MRGRTGAALSRGSLSSCHPVWRCSWRAAGQDVLSRPCHGGLRAFFSNGSNQPVLLPFRVRYSQGEALMLKAQEVFGKSFSSCRPPRRVMRDPQQIQREGLMNAENPRGGGSRCHCTQPPLPARESRTALLGLTPEGGAPTRGRHGVGSSEAPLALPASPSP